MMKQRYLLIFSIVLIGIGLILVGHNAKQAQSLANQAIQIDTAGQSTVVARQSLASYAHQHMGASTQLVLGASYQRATASANAPASGDVYQAAQAACVSHTSAVNQANCVQAYLAAHPTASPTNSAPNKSSYTFNFTAPAWTPDAAGLTLLAGVLVLALTIWRWVMRRF